MTGPALEARSLHYAVSGRDIVRGVSVRVMPGEVLAVLGPSGAGKSTLLHLLGGLLSPTAGELAWAGEAVRAREVARTARQRARHVGLIFQGHHLLDDLSVLGNVALPGLVLGRDASGPARELLRQVGLSERAGERPGVLSGGERQRVALCRALVLSPAVLLADEPTGSLDRENAAAVARLIVSLARERGCGVVLATHDPELAAQAGRRLQLLDGAAQPD